MRTNATGVGWSGARLAGDRFGVTEDERTRPNLCYLGSAARSPPEAAIPYRSRPGCSPIVAGLFAAEVITARDRVLDVGCGTGTDCIALKRWGVRFVKGIDSDEDAIRAAERRARRFGVWDVDMFHFGSVTRMHDCFREGEFSVILDSLALNNIEADAPGAVSAYARQTARVLRPGGRLILQLREHRHFAAVDDPHDWLPPSFRRWFRLGPVVTTHLAEEPQQRGQKGHATVGVCVGIRRAASPLPRRRSGEGSPSAPR